MSARMPLCSMTLCLLAGLSAAADKEPTAAEIAKLVATSATEKPDWWDATALNYPATLDLTCTRPAKGSKWNPKVVAGQWNWDVVNPNQGRWKEGTKFWHFVLSNAKENKLPEAELQATNQLAHCYNDLLQDWPRALYWLEAAENIAGKSDQRTIDIANAYWQLGNRTIAVKTLKSLRQDATRHGSLIKLWADLGDYDTAYKLASQRVAATEDVGYLMAGYTAQLEGSWAKALDFFNRAAKSDQKKSGRDWKQSVERANSAIAAITLFESLDLAKVADGTYQDSSTGYSGPVAISLTVKNHQITDLKVTKHQEKQYYSSLDETPAKIIAKQHVKNVDATLGATITSEAIVYASAKALQQGQR